MGCIPINLSKEEVTNIIINKGLLFELTPDDTVDDILARKKYLQDNMYLPNEEDAKYSIFGNLIEQRISSLAKQKFEKRLGRSSSERMTQQPDNIKKRNAGIRVHQIMAELMEVMMGTRQLSEVQKNAVDGAYGVSGLNFKELYKLAKELFTDIQNLQKEIDPKGKVTILVEQRTLDPITGRGGTMDINAIFSDGTSLVYDYKTTHSTQKNFQRDHLTDDLLHENKIADNELSMAEYKRIEMQRMGAKGVRQTRLIPIHIRLQALPIDQQTDFNYRSDIIELVETSSSSPYLKSIPVAGEATKNKGINEIIERQYNLLNTLTEKLDGKLTIAERDRINGKIKSLRKAIRSALTDGEINDILNTVNGLISEVNTRIKIPEMTKDNKSHPLYLSDIELQELEDETKIYTDIIENISIYYRELQENNLEEFEKLKKKISPLGSNISFAYADIRNERQKRVMEKIEDEYQDSKGGLKPLTELDFFTRNFTRMSEIDHPIFRAAWKLIQDKLYDQREELKKISEDVDAKDKAVAIWAKANGMTKLDALRKIINFESGSLIHRTSKELNEKIDSAYTNPNIEQGSKELEKYLEIKDPNYKENFKLRYDNYKERMKFKYLDDPKGYKQAIESWYISNNLLESQDAWTNRYNRTYLKIKDSVEKANYSDEYKAIMNSKPLLDYYNMYTKYNNLFRQLLGITHYNELPVNFIPNIRKSMVESIAMDDLSSSFKYIGHEFWDSFNARQEDVYISDIDSSGALRRTIPILFVSPLRNKDRDIDNTQKSYDLSKNLMLFSKMAYNYQAMSEIEPVILSMRELMANPTSEHGGTQVVDKNGNKVVGKIRDYATKKGFDTDTYKVFEDLTDFYLYGIKFKPENSLSNNAKLTKTVLKLKDYYAKKTLSFAMLPGIGAYLAGNVASFFEGVKEISYTKANIVGAVKNKTTEFKKFKSLSKYYDVYNEDPINAMADSKSANWFTKLGTTRNMFYPLRKADELMNDDILNRMALNWGIDTENILGKGKNALIRLNRPDLDTKGIKTIWELTTLDEKTGKMTIEGLTKENFIEFRNAVKSTSANIIGSLSQEDISRIDTHLVYNLMFQFKSWMPGVIRERSGNLIYDNKLQAVRWGRYKAAMADYKLTSSEMDGAQKINSFISEILLPNIGKLVLDLTTFGLAFKTGLGTVSTEYTDSKGQTKRVRINPNRAKRMYMDWMLKQPELQTKVTFEMFLETKEAQMKAMIVELRTILSFISLLLFLGADGDDDGKPRYMENYLTRLVYKSMAKANSELTFMWSPAQMAQIIKNPIPMSAVLTDVIKLFKNTFDESRDVIFGENSPYDKSGIFFYTIQMAYGGNQIARFLELYQQYEKNPYVITGATGQ